MTKTKTPCKERPVAPRDAVRVVVVVAVVDVVDVVVVVVDDDVVVVVPFAGRLILFLSPSLLPFELCLTAQAKAKRNPKVVFVNGWEKTGDLFVK